MSITTKPIHVFSKNLKTFFKNVNGEYVIMLSNSKRDICFVNEAGLTYVLDGVHVTKHILTELKEEWQEYILGKISPADFFYYATYPSVEGISSR